MTTTYGEVQKDAAQIQKDSGQQLTGAWEGIKSKVGEAVVPQLARFATSIAKSAGAMDPLIGTIGVLLSAFEGAAKFIGLIGPKTEGEKKQEKFEKAAEALKQFDASAPASQTTTKRQRRRISS